ncbi:MAG: biotin--[acetyl-CoA-carboxylase] ligase [Planctomycetota bacterium]
MHVVECTSTQDMALRDPEPGCAAYWADHQTRGRGRQGRVWYDEPAQDVTVTFRLDGVEPEKPWRLPAAIPIAVLRALERLATLHATLKWPNDVMVAGRKLAGILIDADGNPPRYAIGIGVNVGRTSFPAELLDSATSLALLTGREFAREAVVEELALALDQTVTSLLTGDVADLLATFRARSELIDREVEIEAGNRRETGRVVDVDLDQLTLAEGRRVPLAVVQTIRRRG